MLEWPLVETIYTTSATHTNLCLFSRNFFLTQFGDAENLDVDGILEMDLAQLSIEQSAGDQKKREYWGIMGADIWVGGATFILGVAW